MCRHPYTWHTTTPGCSLLYTAATDAAFVFSQKRLSPGTVHAAKPKTSTPPPWTNAFLWSFIAVLPLAVLPLGALPFRGLQNAVERGTGTLTRQGSVSEGLFVGACLTVTSPALLPPLPHRHPLPLPVTCLLLPHSPSSSGRGTLSYILPIRYPCRLRPTIIISVNRPMERHRSPFTCTWAP